MRKLYALLVLALTMGFVSSEAQAQYDWNSYLVRTITNDFQDIQGLGTDITADMQMTSQYDAYYRVSNKEYTIPFNFRWVNDVSNKIKVTAMGGVIVGGSQHVSDNVQYLYTYYDYYWYYIPYTYSGANYQYGVNNLISPFSGLMVTTAETKYHIAVLGSAPNRVVIVQASKLQDYLWGYTPSVGSWQVKMYESGVSRAELHYRRDAVNSNWNTYGYYYYGYFIGGTKNDGFGSSGWIGYRSSNLTIYSDPGVAGATPSYSLSGYPSSYYNKQLPSVGYRIFIAYPYDLAASLITNPLLDQIINKDIAFTPRGVITNEGSSSPSTATIRRRITLFGTGEVYNQSMNITPPPAFTGMNVAFPDFTPTVYGIYYDTMEVVSTNPADQAAGNNVTYTTYVVSPPNNIKGIAITNPSPGSRTPINIPTPVGARFRNLGANNQINVPVSMVIYSPEGQVIYRDTVRFPALASSEIRDTSFRDWTPTAHGTYRFCAVALLGNDQLRADDTACATALVRYETDAAANVIFSPEADEEKPEKKVFKVFGRFQSVGVADLFDIPARLLIRRCSDNSVVFSADSIIPELNVDAGNVNFGFPTRTQNGQFDVTKLAPGCYNACVIVRYPTDGDRTNDTACTTFSIIPQLRGNIEVGKGRRFPTIAAAVDSMRFRGVGGDLTLILTDSYYREDGNTSVRSPWGNLDFSDIIGLSEDVRVTWKPKAGVSPRIAIYGNAPHGFYFGAGAPAYMTFDGMNQLAPTPEKMVQDPSKRGITIVDSSSIAGSLFAFEHGFSHNMTLKNLKLIGRGMMTNDSSSVIRLYNERSTNTFTLNRITDTMPAHHITIENNEIGNARYGIWDKGLAPLFSIGPAKFFDRRNHDNVIARNTIGTMSNPIGLVGIMFDNEDRFTVRRNEISYVNANLAGGGIAAGIRHLGHGNVTDVAIDGNKIHNVTGTSQTLGVQFTQNASIYTQGSGQNISRSTLPQMTNNRVSNNMIYDLRGSGSTVVPVSFSTMSTTYWTNGDSVYHNSISTSNAMYNVYMAQVRHPFVKNNIIQNTNTGGTAVANYYFEVPRPFAGRVASDYNLFDVRNLNRFATVVERDEVTGNQIQTRHFRTSNDWRTFTQQDVHSVFGDPRFVSDSLHLPGALSYISTAASNNGTWIGSQLQSRDIDGDLRQQGNQTPDIGADEVEGFELTDDLAVMAIYRPAGYSSTSDTTFVVTENPLAIQGLVKNLSQGALYQRTVNARVEVALNGGAWQQIWSGQKSGLTFDLNESKIVDFVGPTITQQQEQQGVFRVTLWVGNDQHNANNMQTKSFRVMIKRQAVLLSYDPTTSRGLQNKDSAATALRRLGVAYDSLNRADFTTIDIDYAPWWTVVYTVGDASLSSSGALSFKQTEELVRYLNAGQTWAKKSLVLSGQNIAFYNDLNQIAGNGVTDREFMRGYVHAKYVNNAPVSGSYADTIDGKQVYFQFREYLNASTPDVVAKTVNTAPVGEEVSGIAYAYRNHALTPTDSAAGTTWSGKTYNVVFFAFDFADVKQTPKSGTGVLTDGATRVMRGALDFIQSFRGTVLPVSFVNVDVTALSEGNQITWQVAEQKDVARFEIESLSNDLSGNAQWTTVGTVGSSKYSYTDAQTTDGQYTYRVVAVDLDGSRTQSMVRSVLRTSERGFALEQNYPNPFNPSTTIGFTLAEPAMVTINILDVTGKVVATVANQQYGMGSFTVPFVASEGSSQLVTGTYVYEMTAVTASGETIRLARKMTLNK